MASFHSLSSDHSLPKRRASTLVRIEYAFWQALRDLLEPPEPPSLSAAPVPKRAVAKALKLAPAPKARPPAQRRTPKVRNPWRTQALAAGSVVVKRILPLRAARLLAPLAALSMLGTSPPPLSMAPADAVAPAPISASLLEAAPPVLEYVSPEIDSPATEVEQLGAFRYLVERHNLTPLVAAGIMGNLMAESRLDPTARNGCDVRTADGQCHPSIGLAQWNDGRPATRADDRLRGLREFAARMGQSEYDFNTQLDYIVCELGFPTDFDCGFTPTETYARDRLLGATTLAGSTLGFLNYERPFGWSRSAPQNGHNARGRFAFAQQLAAMYQNYVEENGGELTLVAGNLPSITNQHRRAADVVLAAGEIDADGQDSVAVLASYPTEVDMTMLDIPPIGAVGTDTASPIAGAPLAGPVGVTETLLVDDATGVVAAELDLNPRRPADAVVLVATNAGQLTGEENPVP